METKEIYMQNMFELTITPFRFPRHCCKLPVVGTGRCYGVLGMPLLFVELQALQTVLRLALAEAEASTHPFGADPG